MVIFHSYVKLPEGKKHCQGWNIFHKSSSGSNGVASSEFTSESISYVHRQSAGFKCAGSQHGTFRNVRERERRNLFV